MNGNHPRNFTVDRTPSSNTDSGAIEPRPDRDPRPRLADCLVLAEEARDLIDAPALARLRDLADSVPPYADQFGFEVRLSGTDPSVDLGLSFARIGDAARELFAAAATRDESDPGWNRLARFGECWNRSDSAIATRVPFIFLEFDAPVAGPAARTPSVFVALDWPLTGSQRWRPGLDSCLEAVPILTGRPLHAELAAALESCFAHSPEQGGMLHVGVMLGRAEQIVRLSMLSPRDQLFAFLHSVGWEGDLGRIHALLDRFADPGHSVQVDFDLSPEVTSKLGFAFRPRNTEAWRNLLGRLVADHLCSKSKRSALLAWPGEAIVPMMRRPLRSVHERYLSHVKISLAAGMPLDAKAYFGASPKYLASRAVLAAPED